MRAVCVCVCVCVCCPVVALLCMCMQVRVKGIISMMMDPVVGGFSKPILDLTCGLMMDCT